MSGIAQNLLQAFGGSVNLTAILALLGGWTGISMILLSPIMAFIIKVKWSKQKKNLSVWGVSFVFIGIGMYITHAFTGSFWDIGTWATAWGALGLGATGLHDKLWGTNGNGLSTFIEKNVWPGTDVRVPTTKAELIPAAKAIAKDLFADWLESKDSTLAKDAATGGIYTGAGTAGAFPDPDTAPLAGGATIDTTVAVDPTKMAAQAILTTTDSHSTTGQSHVPENATLPTVPLNAPHITPAPADQETIDKVTAAIAAGESVEDIVGGTPEEEAVAPGGSE